MSWRVWIPLGSCWFLIYALLGQDAMHGYDVYQILRAVDSGSFGHPRHVLAQYVMGGAWELLRPLGVSLYTVLLLLSAASSAVGVVLSHAAARTWGLEPRAAVWTALLVGACPAVFFFATVVEFHGLFFGFAGLAWLLFAAWVSRGGCGWPIALGLGTALAAGMHITGHALVFVFGCLWCLLGFPRYRDTTRYPGVTWSGIALVAFAHAGGSLLLDAGLSSGAGGVGGIALVQRELEASVREASLSDIVVREWLLAYIPISVLAFAGLRLPTWRPVAIGFTVSALGYLAMTAAVLRMEVEHGAYLLPLAFPGALLVAVSATRWLPHLALISVGFGIYGVLTPENTVGDMTFARDALDYSESREVQIMVGGRDQLDGIVKIDPGAAVFSALAIGLELDADLRITYTEAAGGFDVIVAHARAEGSFLVTPEALEVLTEHPNAICRRLATEHIPDRYTFEEVGNGTFRAFELIPKS